MVENAKHSINIDLNQFKLHIDLKSKIELTVHFDSPSRRFYFSIIALVVNEMKKIGRITSIPLKGHAGVLTLLNETVAGSAGSSDEGDLLLRIYRKWKDALPNLEEAPLFKVLGRKKEYGEGTGRIYRFTEPEKDAWANLFEYKGSEENVRLKFAIDKIGETLNNILIIYEDSSDADAWEKFISGLKEKKPEPDQPVLEQPEIVASPLERRRTLLPRRYRWMALMAVIVAVLGTITLAIWKTYLKPGPSNGASVEKMAFPLPDKPSIAVLPFVNLSGDPKKDYLSDGITEEIINALSKMPTVFVISRSSTFTYKGKPVRVQQVSEEMGVQYVMKGSVQWSGNRVRITVQLVDALKGHHLFSERYDRELKDIFAIQDEVTIKALTAMRAGLSVGEGDATAAEKGTKNIDAYLKFMQSLELVQNVNKDKIILARRLAEEALALDPKFVNAYANLAMILVIEAALGVSKSQKDSLDRAEELAKKAIALDNSNWWAHGALSYAYVFKKQYDKVLSPAERAVSLNPNSQYSWYVLGVALLNLGRYEEAIPQLKKSLRLSPVPLSQTLFALANSYRFLGRYDEAIATYKKLIQVDPTHSGAHAHLAVTYVLAGRQEEARAEAAEVMRIDPQFSVERYAKMVPYNQALVDQQVKALRKAGLK
jgi:adenylate cyclase